MISLYKDKFNILKDDFFLTYTQNGDSDSMQPIRGGINFTQVENKLEHTKNFSKMQSLQNLNRTNERENNQRRQSINIFEKQIDKLYDDDEEEESPKTIDPEFEEEERAQELHQNPHPFPKNVSPTLRKSPNDTQDFSHMSQKDFHVPQMENGKSFREQVKEKKQRILFSFYRKLELVFHKHELEKLLLESEVMRKTLNELNQMK